jgi:hypothetical protein
MNAQKTDSQLRRQALAGCGEFDMSMKSMKQFSSNVLFERSNMSAHPRLRYVKLARRVSEA